MLLLSLWTLIPSPNRPTTRRSHGTLVRYGRGETISSDLHGPRGLFVVVNGMVRIELSPEDTAPAGGDHYQADVFYIGTGGVGGLTSCLLGGHMPGKRDRDGDCESFSPVLILNQNLVRYIGI